MKRWALIGLGALVVLWLYMKLKKPTNVALTRLDDNPSGPGLNTENIKDYVDESGQQVVSATQLQRRLPLVAIPRTM